MKTPEAPPTSFCPHCGEPLTAVGWLMNQDAGLITFYHNDPKCLCALNCQMVPVQPPLVEMPQDLLPRRFE